MRGSSDGERSGKFRVCLESIGVSAIAFWVEETVYV